MVSAAFLAVPSLWGIQPATISGSPLLKIKTISAGMEFLHAANVNNFQNLFEPDFNNKKWGSLGNYTYHQVQIESLSATPNKSQRNVTIKFEFGEQKNGVNNSAMEKILFLNETYLNYSTLDSTVSSKGKFSEVRSPKPPWKPPWPPPYIHLIASNSFEESGGELFNLKINEESKRNSVEERKKNKALSPLRKTLMMQSYHLSEQLQTEIFKFKSYNENMELLCPSNDQIREGESLLDKLHANMPFVQSLLSHKQKFKGIKGIEGIQINKEDNTIS